MKRLATSVLLTTIYYLLITISPSPVWAACKEVVEVKKKLPDGSEVSEFIEVVPINCLESYVKNLIQFIFPLVGAVALIFLIFGGIRFILSGGEPKALESAKKTVTYGLLGLAIIFSIFLIFNILAAMTGIDLLKIFQVVYP